MSGLHEEPKCVSAPDAKALTGIEQEKKELKKTRGREAQKKYREKNPDKCKQLIKDCIDKNPEKYKDAKRKYRESHREKMIDATRKWKEENREQYDAAKKSWTKTHTEQCKAQRAEYLIAHKDHEAERGKQYRQEHAEQIRDKSRRRRAIKKGTATEKISSPQIYIRDGWKCGICLRSVDPALKYPNPLSPSLDHIVPLSKGGTHTRDNVQLAHLACNVRAKAGGIKQLLLPIR